MFPTTPKPAAERARSVAESQDLAGKKEAIQGTISGASKLVASRLRHDSEQAAETARDMAQEHLPQQDSGLSKWIWLGAGHGFGWRDRFGFGTGFGPT